MRFAPAAALALVSLSLCSVVPIEAQEFAPFPEMRAGARLRVTGSTNERLTGRMLYVNRDTVAIVRMRDSLQLPRLAITRIEESAGRSRVRGALRGAGFGAVIGMGVLGITGLIADSDGADEGQTISASAVGVVVGFVVGVPAGAVVGAIIGRERWQTRWERR